MGETLEREIATTLAGELLDSGLLDFAAQISRHPEHTAQYYVLKRCQLLPQLLQIEYIYCKEESYYNLVFKT